MSELNLLVKLRDAHRMAADALEERLEALAPKGVTDAMPDFEGIIWKAATGPKGAYEKSEDINNPRFHALLKTLQVHEGKMTLDGYFMWIMDCGLVIARKKLG